MGAQESVISKSIEASADVSKAAINGDTEKYKARLEHLNVQERESTQEMLGLFTLLEKTNEGTLDAIKDLNGSVTKMYEVLLKSGEETLKQYQETLRSLGNNISDQSKNFAAIVTAGASYDKDMQREVLVAGKDVIRDVKDSLMTCFSMITKLAEKHDARFSTLCKEAQAKLSITEATLNKLVANEELFMKKTLEVIEKHQSIL